MTPNPDPSHLRAELERLRRLYDVAKAIHESLDASEALDRIVQEAVRLVHASSGSVVLLNPTTGFLEIQATAGLPENATALKLRPGEGVTGWVARTGQTARIDDVTRDPRYIPLRPEVRSELAVPLEVAGGTRGVLNVDSDRPAAFSQADQDLLQELALQAARAIHNSWLYEQLRHRVQLFESLASVSQTINSTLALDDILQVITREGCQLMLARTCALLLVDATGEWLDLRACHGASEDYRAKPPLRIQESLLGVVVRRRKPIQVENVQTSARYQSVELARQEGLVSLLSVPLVFGPDTLGTLSVYTGAPHVFSNEEISILAALGALSATAIHKARLYARIVDVEEQLRRNEKLSALGLLAAEVAHEIRNPLTVMKMLYHSLDLRFAEGDPRQRDAEIIGEKMEHLNRIVEQILSFARTSEPRIAPVAINTILEELALLTRHKLRQQHIDLRLILGPDLPLVPADATQLEQAFLNLILNAAEAMPKGGTLTLVSRLQPAIPETPAAIRLAFTDTGGGMSLEQRQELSGAFLKSTKPGGTGLGLAIVLRIIEAHRGQLHIDSQPGRGTTIVILLPLE